MEIFERLSRTLKKLFFSTPEPAYHIWAAYLLNRELEELEDEESISGFKSKISRIRKNKYRMELELSLTEQQAKKRFSDLVGSLPKLKGGD